MGIYKVKSIYAYGLGKSNKVHFSNYAGSHVFIDAYSVIYKDCIGQRNSGQDVMDASGKSVTEMHACLKVIIKCFNENIVPVFVFDGTVPETKSEIMEKRKLVKQKAENSLQEVIDKFNNNDQIQEQELAQLRSQYIKLYKRSFRISHENIKETIRMLKLFGIPVVEAVGEADVQCAALARYYDDGKTCVLTDDMDPILYGAPRIIRLNTITGDIIEEFSVDDFVANVSKKTQKKFTFDDFANCCCIMGTDHYKGLSVDFQKALDMLLTRDKRIDFERIAEARSHYKDILVTDPAKIQVNLTRPNTKILKSLLCTFLEYDCVQQILSLVENNYRIYSDPNIHMKQNDKFSSFNSYKYRHTMQKYNISANKNPIKLTLAYT